MFEDLAENHKQDVKTVAVHETFEDYEGNKIYSISSRKQLSPDYSTFCNSTCVNDCILQSTEKSSDEEDEESYILNDSKLKDLRYNRMSMLKYNL